MFSEKIVCYISAWHDFEMVKLLSPEKGSFKNTMNKRSQKKPKINQQQQKLEHDIKEPLGWILFFFQRNGACWLLQCQDLCSWNWTFITMAEK